jgi:flagellin
MTVDLKSWDPRATWNTADAIGDIGSTDNAISQGTDASAYGTASLVYDDAADNAEDGVQVSTGTDATLDKFIDITTADNAAVLVKQIDTAVTAAASERAKLGAYINRLEYAADNLANVAQNTDASRSRIEDADYADETSELARTQIISQASTAMLAQANQVKQSVLALLQ